MKLKVQPGEAGGFEYAVQAGVGVTAERPRTAMARTKTVWSHIVARGMWEISGELKRPVG